MPDPAVASFENPIVLRGGVEIDAPRDDTRSDIVSLLALGLRLDNVGIFLGAGASCAAGGMTMQQIWPKFVAASPDTVKWLTKAGVLPASGKSTAAPNIETVAGGWIYTLKCTAEQAIQN